MFCVVQPVSRLGLCVQVTDILSPLGVRKNFLFAGNNQEIIWIFIHIYFRMKLKLQSFILEEVASMVSCVFQFLSFFLPLCT